MEELNSVLHTFYHNIVEASRTVCQDSIGFGMTQVIIPLLERVADLDARFKCISPMPNEAYFQGMKTSCVNEFELTVILTHLLTMKIFCDIGCEDNGLACYGHVIPQQAQHPLGDILIEPGLTQGAGLISSLKVRQIFGQLLIQAASQVPAVQKSFEVVFKEPYTIVKIFRGQDLLLFKLVPTFAFPGWPDSASAWPDKNSEWLNQTEVKVSRDFGFFAQALPCPTVPGDGSLFRISFSCAEKYILRTFDPESNKDGDSDHYVQQASAAPFHHPSSSLPGVPRTRISKKTGERILRMLRECDKDDFAPVNSYHMKTVLLHQCQRYPDLTSWDSDKLGERFLELLRDIIVALDRQELLHFFIRDCNLLRFYTPEQLAAASSRLKAIYHDICMSPSNSIRLQC